MASCRTTLMLKRTLPRQAHRCFCSPSVGSNKLTNADVRKKRNEMFEAEKKRQLSLIKRVEKIQVEHRGPPEDCTLVMNKDLSTPYNCAMHVGQVLMDRSVLALVNGQLWDLHRPLTEDCELKFLHFKDKDPKGSNLAFWRTCSFILGHILETAFKEEHYVELCSFPRPKVQSGSFVYDADVGMPDWYPSQSEFRCMGMVGSKLRFLNLDFERLDIDGSLALKMFEDNRFKSAQIPNIAGLSKSGNSVTVYRMGDHIDISRGPLISSTRHIGRYNLVAVHNIETEDFGMLKRFQGVGLPTQVQIHHWTYERLLSRAAKLNPALFPDIKKTPTATLQIASED